MTGSGPLGTPAGGGTARRPAVAGRFYPSDPGALARLVDGLLDAATVPDDDPPAAGYIVPHAGYRYSGPTAAYVYARLRRHADRIVRVVLLGPAHHVPLSGCAVPASSHWLTPLGELPVDTDAVRALVADGHAAVDEVPHVREHSLEVQLPFLQRALRADVPVLPVVAGRSSVAEVAGALAVALGDERGGTVVLCSTDLSHYLDDGAARERDARTARAVLDLAPERIGVRDACGVYGLRGVVGWACERGLRPELLHLCTSADTAGDTARVVGYGAFAFRPAGPSA
jgi:MEMO1 family protein